MAQTVAKGSLALTIDESELEARLDFSPDPNGAEWTGDKLLRLAMDARIGGIAQRRAEDILGKFARAKAPVREILARGQAPESPRPEEAEWSDLPVPEEIREVLERVLLSAPPPELYRVSSETVKVEKTITKPAALHFLSPKKEKVLVSEKREVRERVFPNPEIVKTGFAHEGERLGLLSPAKPGKVGKSIFGKPLQPAGEEATFILGNGVLRNKNELTAECDGIFRAGMLWAEVIPLAVHRFTLERSADGASFLLTYTPGHPELPIPEPAAILAEAAEMGAPENTLLSEEELKSVLSRAVTTGETLKAFPLSTDRDASAEVSISPDGLRATLTVRKGRGSGKPLELSAISAALKTAALRGIRIEELKKTVLDFYKGQESELLDYLLVEGKAPSRGKDRAFALTVSFLPEERSKELLELLSAHPGIATALPSLGDFSLEATTGLAFVQAGQRIGELSPGAPGQPGVDVHGTALPCLPGNDPVIRTFENVVFAKGLVTASITGLLLASEKEGAWSFRVLPYRDSSCEISIPPDGMSALLSLQAEEGFGRPLAVETVLQALKEKGVVYGLDPQAVSAAVAAAREGEPVLRRPVAAGKAPVAAGDVKLDWLVRLATGAAVSLGVDGRADYKNQDRITRVAAGDPLLRIEKIGGDGEAGIDVLGRPISPPNGDRASAPPEHDASVKEERGPDGVLVYSAAVTGELLVEGGRMSIRERLVLKGDVGPMTGNVRFPGGAQVSGTVLTGYQLFCGGDAVIGGSVEAALVSSEGSVHIVEGVKGHKRGTIRAKKTIDAAFAEQALLLAVEDVRLKNACILCNVKTNGKLELGGDRGALIGGLIRARKGVEAAVLGSENGIKTEISFGQDYLMADMIETEEREIEKIKAALLQADRAMAELENTGAGLDRMRQDKVKLLKLLEKRTLRVFDFREKFEEHFPSEVLAKGTVYPGVILESHNRFFEVRSKKNKVAFSFDPALGRIVERQL